MTTDGAPITIGLPWQCGSVSVAGSAGPHGSGETNGPDAERVEASLKGERAALRSARAALEDAVAQLAESRLELVREADQQLLELALGIARKVLAQEIQAQRYEIDPIIQEALRHVPTHQDAVVRLNPDDYARCTMVREQGSGEKPEGMRFLSDPSVQPAQCVVETPQGGAESSPEARLQDIAEVLAGGQGGGA